MTTDIGLDCVCFAADKQNQCCLAALPLAAQRLCIRQHKMICSVTVDLVSYSHWPVSTEQEALFAHLILLGLVDVLVHDYECRQEIACSKARSRPTCVLPSLDIWLLRMMRSQGKSVTTYYEVNLGLPGELDAWMLNVRRVPRHELDMDKRETAYAHLWSKTFTWGGVRCYLHGKTSNIINSFLV